MYLYVCMHVCMYVYTKVMNILLRSWWTWWLLANTQTWYITNLSFNKSAKMIFNNITCWWSPYRYSCENNGRNSFFACQVNMKCYYYYICIMYIYTYMYMYMYTYMYMYMHTYMYMYMYTCTCTILPFHTIIHPVLFSVCQISLYY